MGTRSWAPADSDLEWIRGQGIKFYNMPTIDAYGWEQVRPGGWAGHITPSCSWLAHG